MNSLQLEFLDRASAEAIKAAHPFPQMAAAEAALESGHADPVTHAMIYGGSQLAREDNNLFGLKCHKHPDHPEFGEVALPTREFINGQWIATTAEWMKYASWAECFADRMATLKRLAPIYPHYGAALKAEDAYGYVTEVSKTWSTDPNRAAKVISIYQEYLSSNEEHES